MKIPDPDIYTGKRIRVYASNGTTSEGKFCGYNFDYDNTGNEFAEIDVKEDTGICYGFAENEVDRIDVISSI